MLLLIHFTYLPIFFCVENVLVATEMHPADGKASGGSSGKPTFWKTKHWAGMLWTALNIYYLIFH